MSALLMVVSPFPSITSLFTNGTFASDTGWTKEVGWTISGGAAHKNGGDASTLYQSAALVAGATYRFTYTISNYSTGNLRPSFSGGSLVYGPTRTSNGTFTDDVVAVTGNNVAGFTGASTSIFDLDNVSLVRIA